MSHKSRAIEETYYLIKYGNKYKEGKVVANHVFSTSEVGIFYLE
jgi:hypothetical protein